MLPERTVKTCRPISLAPTKSNARITTTATRTVVNQFHIFFTVLLMTFMYDLLSFLREGLLSFSLKTGKAADTLTAAWSFYKHGHDHDLQCWRARRQSAFALPHIIHIMSGPSTIEPWRNSYNVVLIGCYSVVKNSFTYFWAHKSTPSQRFFWKIDYEGVLCCPSIRQKTFMSLLESEMYFFRVL